MKKVITSILLFLFVFPNVTVSASSDVLDKVEDAKLKLWDASYGVSYIEDEYVTDGITIKKVLQDFTSNGDSDVWNSASLFTEVEVGNYLDDVEKGLDNGVQLSYVVVDTLEKINVDDYYSDENAQLRDEINQTIEDKNFNKDLTLDERNVLADNLIEIDKILGTEGNKLKDVSSADSNSINRLFEKSSSILSNVNQYLLESSAIYKFVVDTILSVGDVR